MRTSRLAFSLVELSVVIVILGLLAGGIVAGQTLINASRVRGISAQAASYVAASENFTQQYGELPGDIARAAQIWSGVSNGDGDGLIEGGSSSENFQMWLHLSRAGLITGTYTGVAGSGGSYHAVPKSNVPAGPLTNTAFWAFTWADVTGDANFFPGEYMNLLVFGTANSTSWPSSPALTSADAYAIDSKADDGMPGQGNIRTFSGTWQQGNGGTGCITATPNGDDPALANYLRTKTKACVLVFLQNFSKKTRI